jgi:excisionase family DNA binding protein
MDQAIQDSDIATVKEVSEFLRVHPSTIYRLLSRKRLPGFRVGSDWRFSLKAIERWRGDAEAGSIESVNVDRAVPAKLTRHS